MHGRNPWYTISIRSTNRALLLTLSLVFLFLGKPDREIASLLSSRGVGSISQYEPCTIRQVIITVAKAEQIYI